VNKIYFNFEIVGNLQLLCINETVREEGILPFHLLFLLSISYIIISNNMNFKKQLVFVCLLE